MGRCKAHLSSDPSYADAAELHSTTCEEDILNLANGCPTPKHPMKCDAHFPAPESGMPSSPIVRDLLTECGHRVIPARKVVVESVPGRRGACRSSLARLVHPPQRAILIGRLIDSFNKKTWCVDPEVVSVCDYGLSTSKVPGRNVFKILPGFEKVKILIVNDDFVPVRIIVRWAKNK